MEEARGKAHSIGVRLGAIHDGLLKKYAREYGFSMGAFAEIILSAAVDYFTDGDVEKMVTKIEALKDIGTTMRLLRNQLLGQQSRIAMLQNKVQVLEEELQKKEITKSSP